jgi:hypothetical protein
LIVRAVGIEDRRLEDLASRDPEEAMAQEFKKGDRVTWKSHGGEAEGTVEKKITSDTEEAGRKVKASPEEPQYLVRSEKSGGTAVHKPDALTKSNSKS